RAARAAGSAWRMVCWIQSNAEDCGLFATRAAPTVADVTAGGVGGDAFVCDAEAAPGGAAAGTAGIEPACAASGDAAVCGSALARDGGLATKVAPTLPADP